MTTHDFRMTCTGRDQHPLAVLGNLTYDADLRLDGPARGAVLVRRPTRTLVVEDTPDGREKLRVRCNFCGPSRELLLRAENIEPYFRRVAATGVLDLDISLWPANMVLQ